MLFRSIIYVIYEYFTRMFFNGYPVRQEGKKEASEGLCPNGGIRTHEVSFRTLFLVGESQSRRKVLNQICLAYAKGRSTEALLAPGILVGRGSYISLAITDVQRISCPARG